MRYLTTIGFGLAMVLAILAMDFHEHSEGTNIKTRGKSYVHGVPERFVGFLTSFKPVPVARDQLPQAPEGWERRDWTMADFETLPGLAGAEEEKRIYAALTHSMPTTKTGAQRKLLKQRANTSWLYETGAGLVEMAAIEVAPARAGNPIASAALDNLAKANAAFLLPQDYRLVQGVMWQRLATGPASNQDQDLQWWLTARVGEIVLYLRARTASEQAVHALLAAVDYDGLNAMQDRPADGIGTAARTQTPDTAQTPATAQALAEQDGQEKASQEGGQTGESAPQGVLGPEAIRAKVAAMSNRARKARAMEVAFSMAHDGYKPSDIEVIFDGNTPDATARAALFAAGQLPLDAPDHAVRRTEAERGFSPGSCLQIARGDVLCEDKAETLRIAHEIRRVNKRVEQAAPKAGDAGRQMAQDTQAANAGPKPEPAPRLVEVRVNRLPSVRGSRGGTCGGGRFCKVGGE